MLVPYSLVPCGALRGTIPSRRHNRLQRRASILIVFCIVAAIFAPADSFHPMCVLTIPLYRLVQAIIELNLRTPLELLLNLRTIQGVSAVVTGTISHIRDKRLRLPNEPQELPNHLQVRDHLAATNVINLTHSPTLQNRE